MSAALRQRLEQRSALLKRMREFFDSRGFLEVETPLVASEVIPELHIEPWIASEGASPGADSDQVERSFLQASPELQMKRLLCIGFEAIYQITRSFRGGERGRLHRSEFTIVEWYRVGDRMTEGMTLLDDLCQRVAGSAPAERTSYREAFEQHVGVDPHHATVDMLSQCAIDLGVQPPDEFASADRDDWLNLLLSICVEPKLGKETPEILFDYPASQSALAKIGSDDYGNQVAKRFELYWQGVELANGYDELTDAAELRERLSIVNQQRQRAGRPALPLPESLLEAMQSPGLPASSGCALGFDRLAMLVCGVESIDEVSFTEVR